MRRREYLFAFAHILHISPHEVGELTLADFELLTAGLDQYLREMKKGG